MKIRRIYIRSFGKLRNQEMELSPGINLLYGENESGKTTVHTFIKSMFYGMIRQRGRAAKTDTYTTYEPWEEPSSYGGILWFETRGKQFRLSRSFHKSSPKEELICEEDGEILDISQGDLEAVLGDISEAVYENTVSIAQLKSVTGQELVRELQNYMASYQGTGDSSVDLGRAMQMLKMTRKGFQVQKERREKELLSEREKLDAKIAYLKLETDRLENGLKADEEEKNQQQADSRWKHLQEAFSDNQKTVRRLSVFLPLTILFTLLLTAAGIWWLPQAWMAVFPAVAGILAAVFEGVQIRRKKEENRGIRKLLLRHKQKLKKSEWELGEKRREYEEKKTAYQNLENEYLEQELTESGNSAPETEIQSLNLAMATIDMLSERFQMQVGDRLKEQTSRILSEITGGRYTSVLLDKDFRIRVNTRERVVPLESLSRGTLEQIYFALRMAAGELLCKEERFPVILDDVFGMYDEERLAAVLHWLAGQDRQVIISTCNRREMEILDREKIPWHLLEW